MALDLSLGKVSRIVYYRTKNIQHTRIHDTFNGNDENIEICCETKIVNNEKLSPNTEKWFECEAWITNAWQKMYLFISMNYFDAFKIQVLCVLSFNRYRVPSTRQFFFCPQYVIGIGLNSIHFK